MSSGQISKGGEQGPVWAEPRWWSIGYGVRVVAAVVGASIVTGGIVGPGMLMLSQLRASLDGGMLTFPAWMYWQAAGVHIVIGVLLAGVISASAVLLGTRRTSAAIVGRMQSGPLVAGGLLSAMGVVMGGGAASLVSTVPATAVACGVFFAATLVARLTRQADLHRVDPMATSPTLAA